MQQPALQQMHATAMPIAVTRPSARVQVQALGRRVSSRLCRTSQSWTPGKQGQVSVQLNGWGVRLSGWEVSWVQQQRGWEVLCARPRD